MQSAQNRPIVGVKEALAFLGLSRNFFYQLRQRKEVPKMRGYRFLTTTRRLLEWYESLIDGPCFSLEGEDEKPE
jgi:predicted DNA-binding transcriptional regulator AlpA